MAVLCIGHRGVASRAPENTLASFRLALALPCDGVEFDVHRTADGHLVVLHDADLSRTTDGHGRVGELSLAAVRRLDAGAWRGPQFAGERVPTLDEVIAATGDMQLFIELKAGSDQYPGIEVQLLHQLARAGVMERAQISSFDHAALQRLRAADPRVPLGMLYFPDRPDAVAAAQALGANALHPYWEYATPELVAAAHAAGLQCFVWTVNHEEHLAQALAAGVDGIMSDRPEIVPRAGG